MRDCAKPRIQNVPNKNDGFRRTDGRFLLMSMKLWSSACI